MRIAVVGGGIAGLAAARRLEGLLPEAEIVLVEKDRWLGGKLLTERLDGFLIEAGADSILSRKQRGVALCEELGLAPELVGRRPEHPETFLRRGGELHPLPAGLTGLIPTSLDAFATSPLLSPEGRRRLAAEVDLPPAPQDGDESIASFVSRRLGSEAYEALVEPLLAGIFGGDGEHLSLQATFPNLRALELEHGSVIRGLLAATSEDGSSYPPFVALRSGMATLPARIVGDLRRTRLLPGCSGVALRATPGGYRLAVETGTALEADGVVLALPAFAAAELLATLDGELATAHAEIPHASSAIVTLGYRREDIARPLDGYGYLIPRVEGGDVLACTWTSSKWPGRAPEGGALLRVYAGRFGGRDVTLDSDDDLISLARDEVGVLEVTAEPAVARVHRWPGGMPQYVLGHLERIERIEAALAGHAGLALAGAAYRGVGIPDCIASGEDAAESIARSLSRAYR